MKKPTHLDTELSRTMPWIAHLFRRSPPRPPRGRRGSPKTPGICTIQPTSRLPTPPITADAIARRPHRLRGVPDAKVARRIRLLPDQGNSGLFARTASPCASPMNGMTRALTGVKTGSSWRWLSQHGPRIYCNRSRAAAEGQNRLI